MSVSDYGLWFCMIFFVVAFFHVVHLTDSQTARIMQEQYNLAVDHAVEAALYGAVEMDSGSSIILNEKMTIDNFFQALYINLGIMENPMKKELCKFYVPFIAFVENERVKPYIQVSEGKNSLISFQAGKEILYQWKSNNGQVLQFTLSDYVIYESTNEQIRIEGNYKDVRENLPLELRWTMEEFHEKKKSEIIESIKQCVNYCVNYQNQLAARLGIHYEFSLPFIEYEDWYRTVQDVSMFALMQGYPYGNGVTGVYNRFAFGGARIAKRKETAMQSPD